MNEVKKISYQNNVFSLIRELMSGEGVGSCFEVTFAVVESRAANKTDDRTIRMSSKHFYT